MVASARRLFRLDGRCGCEEEGKPPAEEGEVGAAGGSRPTGMERWTSFKGTDKLQGFLDGSEFVEALSMAYSQAE